MGQAAKVLRPMEAEEYLAWEASQPERHELLEGMPHVMAGASLQHNLVVGNLYALLEAFRLGRVRLHQEAPFAPLYVEPGEGLEGELERTA